MSARRSANNGSATEVKVEAEQTCLTLSPGAVIAHKNGIEFRSSRPFAVWREMTMSLQSAGGDKVCCSGVVISCTGNKHTGYHVSMVLTGLSRQAQARLSAMVYAPFNSF